MLGTYCTMGLTVRVTLSALELSPASLQSFALVLLLYQGLSTCQTMVCSYFPPLP